MQLGISVLRAVIGALFLGHGLQKLKGWFGGPGLEGTAQGFQAMGLAPPKQQALAAGLTETTAGALLVSGLATPVASSMVSGAMTVAIRKVHGPQGLWVTSGGYEYNLVLMASVFAITADGPGTLSLDHALGITRNGIGYACAQLGAGVLGAMVLEQVSARASSSDSTDTLDLREGHADPDRRDPRAMSSAGHGHVHEHGA